MRYDRILITGGSGSLGTRLLYYFLSDSSCTSSFTLLSRNEKAQYLLRNRLDESLNEDAISRTKLVLGDIRENDKISQLIKDSDFIIHAAALKHIVMGEEQPEEFVRTNVIGSSNVINNCRKFDKRMILISTDKACMPVNIYGMTKAIAERITINAGFSCVRYGNVAASSGSIIPFFKHKISKGESLPITDPKMTRFFLTLDDAVELIIEAMNNYSERQIVVKKAPSFRIIDIAKYMAMIYGKTDNYPMHIIGLQTLGEKIHEMLIAPHEVERVIDCGSYYRILPPGIKSPSQVLDEPYTSEVTVENVETQLKELFNRIREITY